MSGITPDEILQMDVVRAQAVVKKSIQLHNPFAGDSESSDGDTSDEPMTAPVVFDDLSKATPGKKFYKAAK